MTVRRQAGVLALNGCTGRSFTPARQGSCKHMKHLWNSIKILSVIMVFSVLVSCSGSDGSGGSAGGESIYDPGASVPARGYSDSCPIELLIRDASGHFGAVHDGMYVQPGTRRLAVRVEGDQATIDRVFISDGGVYQVEARSGRATCMSAISTSGTPGCTTGCLSRSSTPMAGPRRRRWSSGPPPKAWTNNSSSTASE